MTEQLKPCPFCGGEAVILPYAVVCNNCGAKIETIYKYRMFAAWNTRAEAAQRWIPVTERLPEEGQLVVVFTPINVGDNFRYETLLWRSRYAKYVNNHLWMPLPQPPEAK